MSEPRIQIAKKMRSLGEPSPVSNIRGLTSLPLIFQVISRPVTCHAFQPWTPLVGIFVIFFISSIQDGFSWVEGLQFVPTIHRISDFPSPGLGLCDIYSKSEN